MPTISKLGLDFSVKKLCKRAKFNPVTKLIELCNATDQKSKEELELKGASLKFLIEMMQSKPKPTEVKSVSDTKPTIIHKQFVLSPTLEVEPENRISLEPTNGPDPTD